MNNKTYPAKILLFGEYTVIHGSDSLAIPFYEYSAKWAFDSDQVESRSSIEAYSSFVKKELVDVIDVNELEQDLANGLYLHSTIPRGYGSGSSGSLVAAIYDRYALDKKEDVDELRSIFQKMEAYFHGSSSGIDPLVSYLKKGIYIKNGTLITIDIDMRNGLLRKLFIWDSSVSRKTGPLVDWYKNQLVNPTFSDLVKNDLSLANAMIIKAFLNEDQIEFSNLFEKISMIQKEHFTKMMPSDYLAIIEKLGNFTVKLCGAGGGGFYLLFKNETRDENADLIPLMRP